MGADIDLHDMENELQELLNHRRALDADGTSQPRHKKTTATAHG